MAEYIDREEYCEKHCRCSNEYCDRVSCPIWKAPAADVAPVVHGRWIDAPWLYYGAKQYVCSRCRNDKYWRKRDLHFKEPYCPNCGAKMDGGDSDAKSV